MDKLIDNLVNYKRNEEDDTKDACFIVCKDNNTTLKYDFDIDTAGQLRNKDCFEYKETAYQLLSKFYDDKNNVTLLCRVIKKNEKWIF